MGTEVLHPQDILIQRIRVGRKSYYGSSKPNNNAPRKPRRAPEPSPDIGKRSASNDGFRSKSRNNNQVALGHVTILKRGESIELKPTQNVDVLVLKQIRSSSPANSDTYAGSAAFSLSPSPRALPLPSFFNKKQNQFDDSATKDLRRLLRLE